MRQAPHVMGHEQNWHRGRDTLQSQSAARHRNRSVLDARADQGFVPGIKIQRPLVMDDAGKKFIEYANDCTDGTRYAAVEEGEAHMTVLDQTKMLWFMKNYARVQSPPQAYEETAGEIATAMSDWYARVPADISMHVGRIEFMGKNRKLPVVMANGWGSYRYNAETMPSPTSLEPIGYLEEVEGPNRLSLEIAYAASSVISLAGYDTEGLTNCSEEQAIFLTHAILDGVNPHMVVGYPKRRKEITKRDKSSVAAKMRNITWPQVTLGTPEISVKLRSRGVSKSMPVGNDGALYLPGSGFEDGVPAPYDDVDHSCFLP